MAPRFWQIISLTLLTIDLIFLNFKALSPSPPDISNPQPIAVPTAVDQCGIDCQKYINDKIANLPTQPPTTLKTITTVPIPSRSKIRTISYLPIPTGGSTGNNDWTDLAGTDFYFDTHDYPGLVEIYFETNIHLFNGNGIVFVRLFDATHGVGVQGSEAQSDQQRDTAVVSGKVSFYQGKNLIKVQAKSLTADTAIFTSGRLKIVTEN